MKRLISQSRPAHTSGRQNKIAAIDFPKPESLFHKRNAATGFGSYFQPSYSPAHDAWPSEKASAKAPSYASLN